MFDNVFNENLKKKTQISGQTQIIREYQRHALTAKPPPLLHLKVETDIWEFIAKLRIFCDHFAAPTLNGDLHSQNAVPFRTGSEIWAIIGAPA